MDIHIKFRILTEEWTKHCMSKAVLLSSFTEKELSHPAYRKLIALGKPAIPLIMEQYGREEWLLPWEFVLEEITGIDLTDLVEDRYAYNLDEMRRTWLEWWKEEQKKNDDSG